MAENTPDGNKKLSVEKKTLSLKPRTGGETGVVRQSFSHGRSKQVVVEVKRSRTAPRDSKPEAAAPAAPAPVAKKAAPAAAPVAPTPAAPPPKASGVVLLSLIHI